MGGEYRVTYLEISQYHWSQVRISEGAEGGGVEGGAGVCARRLAEGPVGRFLDEVPHVGAGVARRVCHHLAAVPL